MLSYKPFFLISKNSPYPLPKKLNLRSYSFGKNQESVPSNSFTCLSLENPIITYKNDDLSSRSKGLKPPKKIYFSVCIHHVCKLQLSWCVSVTHKLLWLLYLSYLQMSRYCANDAECWRKFSCNPLPVSMFLITYHFGALGEWLKSQKALELIIVWKEHHFKIGSATLLV